MDQRRQAVADPEPAREADPVALELDEGLLDDPELAELVPQLVFDTETAEDRARDPDGGVAELVAVTEHELDEVLVRELGGHLDADADVLPLLESEVTAPHPLAEAIVDGLALRGRRDRHPVDADMELAAPFRERDGRHSLDGVDVLLVGIRPVRDRHVGLDLVALPVHRGLVPTLQPHVVLVLSHWTWCYPSVRHLTETLLTAG